MKTLSGLSFATFLLCGSAATQAQGPLAPPGAPGLAFRSLLDVEPRFPIYHYETSLTRSGSYSLATNPVGSSTNADGMVVGTGLVTIDFNGFALRNTGGTDTQAEGVLITARDNF